MVAPRLLELLRFLLRLALRRESCNNGVAEGILGTGEVLGPGAHHAHADHAVRVQGHHELATAAGAEDHGGSPARDFRAGIAPMLLDGFARGLAGKRLNLWTKVYTGCAFA